MVLGVGEPHEGKVISGKSFRRRETFDRRLIFDIVEISRVVVAREFVNDGRYVVADGSEVPDVVLEEGMIDDVVDAFVAQPVLSTEKNSFIVKRTYSGDLNTDYLNNTNI